MQRMATCLWFDGRAEEAMKFYTSVFKNSKTGTVTRYGDAGPGEKGSVMTASFEVNGHEFLGLNGGPEYTFSHAISMIVYCDTQEEIDDLWDKLCDGGEPVQCGWLKDKFGLSWQIVPSIVPRLISDKDPARTDRVMKAIFQMVKLDIKRLKEAYGQG